MKRKQEVVWFVRNQVNEFLVIKKGLPKSENDLADSF